MQSERDVDLAELEPYLAGWRRRWAEQRRADAAAAARALRIAGRLAAILRDRFGATRVVLVGSLARGEFRSDSDIDLAAACIPTAEFFRAGAEVEREAEGFKVDLVPLESATPAFLVAVEREGVELLDG